MKRSEAKKPVWARNMNEEQMAVIMHDGGPLCVLAQAGSGKTRALVHRIARLVDAAGVDEERVLAVTFSTKAAAEMNERLKKLDVTGARVGTWHSLCLQIIKKGKLPESAWEVDDTGRAGYVLKDVLGFKHMNWKSADVGQVSSFIGFCKANLFEPDSEEAKTLAAQRFSQEWRLACEAFHRYNELIAQKGILTFDDMLVIVAKYFATNEQGRAQWAAKWDYVIQDEQQDENLAQDTIGEQLARDHRNYMVVGDVAQSIYGFRGARPELLAGFAERWSAKTVTMSKNYRSTKAIIDAANNIIRPAKLRIEADMQCMRDDSAGKATAYAADSLDDEAKVVVGNIKQLVATDDASYDDCTVLFRTNAQSRALEEQLLAEKIPYIVIGGMNFYERKEVKDLLAYLRLAAGTGSVEDVKRSINTPFRFLGVAFVERVMDAVERAGTKHADWLEIVRDVAQGPGIQSRQRDSAEQWAHLIETARQEIAREENPVRPSKILDDVILRTGYLDFLKRDQGEESIENSSIANVREMVRVAERFATANELLTFIDDNIKQARKQRKDGQSGGKRVLLMSIHRSKGLEWPHVFVVGMNEMILPHVRGEIEEERRLAYVAVTRARDTLTLTYVKKVSMASGVREVPPSRFLIDSGLITTQWGVDAPSPVGAMLGGESAALPELQPLP